MPGKLLLHVLVQALVRHVRRRDVLLVQLGDGRRELLGVLHQARRRVQVRLEAADFLVLGRKRRALLDDVLLQPRQLVLQVLDGQVEVRVGLVVPLQLVVHALDGVLHVRDVLLARLDLLLQLLDLVIEHKLELLQLLRLFLQVVDALLLVADGVVAVAQLLAQTRDVLLQLSDGVPQRSLVVAQTGDDVLLLVDVLLELVELLLHDAVLALQAQTDVALLRQTQLVPLLELLDLQIRVLLHLAHDLVGLLRAEVQVALHLLPQPNLLAQLRGELLGELLDDALLALHKQRVLLVPLLVERVLLGGERLVPLHLREHVLLVRFLRGLPALHRGVCGRLELLLELELLLVLRLRQRLVPRLVPVQLRLELVRQVLDLCVHVGILRAHLALVLQHQLRNLHLQRVRSRERLLHVRLGHQNLLGEVLLARAPRGGAVLVLDVEHRNAPVLGRHEQRAVVARQRHLRDRAAVARQGLELARQRVPVRAHGPVARRREHRSALGAPGHRQLRQ